MKSTACPRSTSAWPTRRTSRGSCQTPREAEGQHIGRVVQEVALGQLVQSDGSAPAGGAPLIEGGERFARRQLRRPAQPRDPALVPLLRFEAPGLPRAAAAHGRLVRFQTNRETISRAARSPDSVNPVSQGGESDRRRWALWRRGSCSGSGSEAHHRRSGPAGGCGSQAPSTQAGPPGAWIVT